MIQPVELPAGWELPTAVPPPPLHPTSMPMAAPASAPYRSRTAAMPSPGGPPPMMPPMPPMPPAAPPMSGAPAGAPADGVEDHRQVGGGVSARRRRRARPGAARPGLRPPAGPAAAQPSVEAERRRADSAELRELAAGEARRLRDAADRPDFERRELLEDLGSRLAVLGIGVLRALAERLTPAAIAARPLEELWREVLAELDAVAGAGPSRPPPAGAFWKR